MNLDCIMYLNNVIVSVINTEDEAKLKARFFLSIFFFGNLLLIFSSFFKLFASWLAIRFFFFLVYSISSWFTALVNISSYFVRFYYIRNTFLRQTQLVLFTVTVLVVWVCLNKQKLSKIITKLFIIHENIEQCLTY